MLKQTHKQEQEHNAAALAVAAEAAATTQVATETVVVSEPSGMPKLPQLTKTMLPISNTAVKLEFLNAVNPAALAPPAPATTEYTLLCNKLGRTQHS